MKAVIHHFSKPSTRTAKYEVENLKIEVDLPFVPVTGMSLQVTPAGSFLVVEQVMWAINEPDVLQVFTEEPQDDFDVRPYREMVEQGWRKG
ncbi:hypothetical protein [Paraburkholderia humisilvae]|uniref:Uncharacterized protein n=1 Tax=Paraburkholderia humisilvae TaxID=627669 RepID=A0A6J5DLB8_9BURK|nr:hypothetical protein [Paraburkholderia humisilvae]CAB3754041.1 hypothetical protein LMG29542_02229 [Paraburkholderia humisilvae]